MKKLFFIATLLALYTNITHADITMPKIFSDGMVLQQTYPAAVWGKSSPNAEIEVAFSGRKQKTKADANGEWKLSLKPLKASATPSEMLIFENGKEAKKISNVLVGEVWIAGGQSNMEFALSTMKDADKIIEENASDNLRFFLQWPSNTFSDKPQFDNPKGSQWVSAKDKIGSPSAVAFLFANGIRKAFDIPVGVVMTSMSGTSMYSWVPEKTFSEDPRMEHERKAFERRKASYNFDKALEKWTNDKKNYEEKVAKAKAEGKPAPSAPYTFSVHYPRKDTPDGFRTPTWLYNGKVAPVAGYSARGFIWYQGENDSNKKRELFADQLSALIDSWRSAWRRANMPFLIVQLPSYTSKNWPEIRLAQAQVAKEGKNVFTAVVFDTGEEKDVHPKDKLKVGQRLANIALKEVYRQKNVHAFGPTFKSAQYSRGTVRVSFDMDGSRFARPSGDIKCFEISLDGKNWLEANAKIVSNDALSVSGGGGGEIVGVRYAHKDWAKPHLNLFDADGLPTAPFEDIREDK